MSQIEGFPPIAQPDAVTLILGSMPSRESLARQQYYAHPRNAFWPILCELLGISATDYAQRTRLVAAREIAIWDVLQACFRPGSLDSAIDDTTIVTNDFRGFFTAHPLITRVFFNGAKAEALYRRHVRPLIGNESADMTLRRLPSTSPAHAGMSREQKLQAWQTLLTDRME